MATSPAPHSSFRPILCKPGSLALTSLGLLSPLLSAGCVPAFRPPADSILRIRSDGDQEVKIFGIRDVYWDREDDQTTIIGCGWGDQEHVWTTRWLYMGFWPIGGISGAPENETRWLYVTGPDENDMTNPPWKVELLLGPCFGGTSNLPDDCAEFSRGRDPHRCQTLYTGSTARCHRDLFGNMRLKLDNIEFSSLANPEHTIRVSGTVVARTAKEPTCAELLESYHQIPIKVKADLGLFHSSACEHDDTSADE